MYIVQTELYIAYCSMYMYMMMKVKHIHAETSTYIHVYMYIHAHVNAHVCKIMNKILLMSSLFFKLKFLHVGRTTACLQFSLLIINQKLILDNH